MKNRPLAAICLVFLVIRCLVFWAGAKCEFPPEVLRMDGEKIRVSGRIYKKEQREKGPTWYLRTGDRAYIIYDSEWSNYRIGNAITVTGTFHLFERASNPGTFDSRSYYQNQNIYGMIYPESIKVTDTTIQYGKEWIASLRERWKKELLDRMGEEGAVLSGILLGDKSSLDPEVKELYQKNGIAHLLAVSGLHVSFIGFLIYRAMRKAGVPFLGSALFGILILFPYVVMTGFSVSAKRAVCMYLIRMGAEVTGRVYDLLTSLFVSAAVIVGTAPFSVLDPGFLLSFGAIFSIWGGEELRIRLEELKEKGRRKESDSVMKRKKAIRQKLFQAAYPGLCIQLLTFPVLLDSYYEFPLYSVLVNIWVIPMMSVVMGAGLLGSICCLVLPPLANGILWISKAVLMFYEWNCRIMLKFPFARIVTGEPVMRQILLYLFFLMLAYLLFWKGRGKEGMLALASALILLFGPWNQHYGELEVTMLDVGQGDGILIRTPGGLNCLIDGGSTSEEMLAKYTLEPFLESQRIRTLDYVLISHGDADHISGIQEMLERREVGVNIRTLVLPEQYLWDEGLENLARTAKKAGTKVRSMKAGETIRDRKGTMLSCIGPSEEYDAGTGNEASMILKLSRGKFSMLFTGDMEGAGEEDFLQGENGSGTYTVLKVPHHGSDGATTESFLEQNKVRYALISAGKDNPYGHPGEKLMKRLETCGIRTFCTKENGAITLRVKGETMTIRKFLE